MIYLLLITRITACLRIISYQQGVGNVFFVATKILFVHRILTGPKPVLISGLFASFKMTRTAGQAS